MSDKGGPTESALATGERIAVEAAAASGKDAGYAAIKALGPDEKIAPGSVEAILKEATIDAAVKIQAREYAEEDKKV